MKLHVSRSNLYVSESISWMALSYSFWSKITLPFPLPGLYYNDSFIFSVVLKEAMLTYYVEKVYSCRNKNFQESRDVLLSDF